MLPSRSVSRSVGGSIAVRAYPGNGEGPSYGRGRVVRPLWGLYICGRTQPRLRPATGRFPPMIRPILVALSVCLTLATIASAQERVVNVYNWSDYIDPKVLE